MSLAVTSAIVLHAFDYLEASRVLRLVTRELGVQSVLARGARRARGRVGSAVDLFAEGEAQLHVRPTRDLQTLSAFDVSRARTALALDVRRFAAASAIAELVLRVGGEDASPTLFHACGAALDGIAEATGPTIVERALAGAWSVVAAAGFAPTLDDCASCHAPLAAAETVAFAHPAGGALCSRCGAAASSARRLPPSGRDVLRAWLSGAAARPVSLAEVRAHQRLLREFVTEHISEERPLRAFAAWESGFGSGAVTET